MAKTLLNTALIVGIIALVSVMISLICYLLNPKLHIDSLLIILGICAVCGASGCILSLLLSKWLCQKSYNIQLITTPSNETEQGLYNIVAELAARAQLKMPEVGIYEADEVNAFATGPSKDQSLVAVSTGLLKYMSPAQIRAVLGHEVSHIKSGDMVTSTLLAGVLNTIVFFFAFIIAGLFSMGVSVFKLFFSKTHQSNGPLETLSGGMLNTWGFRVALKYSRMILGFLANFINLGFSRYREYKADAGSAQLLGAPQDMISALQALQQVNQQHPVQESEMSNFCINGADFVTELFSTHPPLEKRIAALQAQAGIVPAPQAAPLPTPPVGTTPAQGPAPAQGQPTMDPNQAANFGVSGVAVAAATTAAVAAGMMAGSPAQAAPAQGPAPAPEAAGATAVPEATAAAAPASDGTLSQLATNLAQNVLGSDAQADELPSDLKVIDTLTKLDQALASHDPSTEPAAEDSGGIDYSNPAYSTEVTPDDSPQGATKADGSSEAMADAASSEESTEESAEESSDEDADEDEGGGFLDALFSDDDE